MCVEGVTLAMLLQGSFSNFMSLLEDTGGERFERVDSIWLNKLNG